MSALGRKLPLASILNALSFSSVYDCRMSTKHDPVPLREARDDTFPMLPNATGQVRGYAGVQRAVGRPSKQVDTGLTFHAQSKEQGRSRLEAGMAD
jgi:hypothetical protein